MQRPEIRLDTLTGKTITAAGQSLGQSQASKALLWNRKHALYFVYKGKFRATDDRSPGFSRIAMNFDIFGNKTTASALQEAKSPTQNLATLSF